MDTLVLDYSMLPHGFATKRRALKLLYLGKATVVEYDSDVEVRTTSFSFKVPRVIRLQNSFKRFERRRIPFSKANIIVRDSVDGNPICQYCLSFLRQNDITFDHVIPKSRGGGFNFENIVLCCKKCNKYKDDRLPEECGMVLNKKPKEPFAYDPRFFSKMQVRKIRSEWKPYLII